MAPAGPDSPPNADATRLMVAVLAAASPWEVPLLALLVAGPPSEAPLPLELPPVSRPLSPPAASSDARKEAPLPVPGSTNANSRNITSGQNAPTTTSTVPTTASPTAAWVDSPAPASTPSVSSFPIPRTKAAKGAIICAEMNHRRHFQNQARVPSDSSPAAEIGEVAIRI